MLLGRVNDQGGQTGHGALAKEWHGILCGKVHRICAAQGHALYLCQNGGNLPLALELKGV